MPSANDAKCARPSWPMAREHLLPAKRPPCRASPDVAWCHATPDGDWCHAGVARPEMAQPNARSKAWQLGLVPSRRGLGGARAPEAADRARVTGSPRVIDRGAIDRLTESPRLGTLRRHCDDVGRSGCPKVWEMVRGITLIRVLYLVCRCNSVASLHAQPCILGPESASTRLQMRLDHHQA